MRSNRSVETWCVLRFRIAVIRVRDACAALATAAWVRRFRRTILMISSVSAARTSISAASRGERSSAAVRSAAVRVTMGLIFFIEHLPEPTGSQCDLRLRRLLRPLLEGVEDHDATLRSDVIERAVRAGAVLHPKFLDARSDGRDRLGQWHAELGFPL